VLARAAFLRSLERLSEVVGAPLPRGAAHVVPTARQIFEKGGEELLGRVAKIHFKTTKSVKGSGG
jgi:ribonuclease HIII